MPPGNGEEVKCNPRSNNHQVSAKEVVVHELSSKPTDFWKRWSKTAKVMRLQVEIVLEIYLILTHFYRTQVSLVRSMGLDVSNSLSHLCKLN